MYSKMEIMSEEELEEGGGGGGVCGGPYTGFSARGGVGSGRRRSPHALSGWSF